LKAGRSLRIAGTVLWLNDGGGVETTSWREAEFAALNCGVTMWRRPLDAGPKRRWRSILVGGKHK